MRKLVVAAVAALAVVAPSSAHAVLFVGARAAFALPSGDVQGGQALDDSVSAQFPIQLDAGLSAFGVLSFGVYGSYGRSMLTKDLRDSQCSGVSCRGEQIRLGLQLNVSPPVVLRGLWGGVFGGLEQQQIEIGESDVKFRGWEAGVQAGYDLSVLPFIKIGPYASYSFAQFTTALGGPQIGVKAQHAALTFGLRGLFDF